MVNISNEFETPENKTKFICSTISTWLDQVDNNNK